MEDADEIFLNQWEIRREDVHILKRSKEFFQKGAIQALKGWIERAQLSSSIVMYNDKKTRKDILK